MLCLLLAVVALVHTAVSAPAEDLSKRDVEAQLCTGNVEFYMDDEMNVCLAALCPRGTERPSGYVKDYSACRLRLWMDFVTCGVNVEHTGSCDFQEKHGFLPYGTFGVLEGEKCPTGSVCEDGGESGGICCEEKALSLWHQNMAAKCPSKRNAVKVAEYVTLFGRKCADNFCPSSSECVQGTYYAYCCGAKEEQQP